MNEEDFKNEISQLWGYMEAEGTEIARLRRDYNELKQEVETLARKR